MRITLIYVKGAVATVFFVILMICFTLAHLVVPPFKANPALLYIISWASWAISLAIYSTFARYFTRNDLDMFFWAGVPFATMFLILTGWGLYPPQT